ncbi:MAG TPA: GNAT family N-acetyltransferase [Acidobacteriaceae bacterium]|nr:GNAT family N-acetyltransferase [Acidobacteriaceae bacterium]
MRRNPKTVDELLLRTFRPGDEDAFRLLNEAWISQHFALEPADREVLDDPRAHILSRGGQVCIAEQRGEVVGCCALIAIAPGELELAKMTVAESARGLGIGRKLLRFAIGVARQMGAHRVYLESNTRAEAAIHLYEQLGFRRIAAPEHPSKYERANVFMELALVSDRELVRISGSPRR